MIQLELFPEKEVRVQIKYGYDWNSVMMVYAKANGVVITSPWCDLTSLLKAFPIIGKCIVAIYEKRHDVGHMGVGYIEVEERT